jgi:hypothetical protein
MHTPTDAAFRISAARLRLMQSGNCGLLAEIGNSLNHTPTDTLETMATDGKQCLYRPEYVDSVSDVELETTLLHEYAHAALLHPVRFDPKTQEHDLANQAMDYAANQWVEECGRTIPQGWLRNPKFDGMAWEAIYTLLKNEQTPPPPQPQAPQPEPDEQQQGDDQPDDAEQEGSADGPQDDENGPQEGDTQPDDTEASDGDGDSDSAANEDDEGDEGDDGKPAAGKAGDRHNDVKPYPAETDDERSAAAAELTDRITRIAQALEMAGHGSANSRRFLQSLTAPKDPDLYQALAQLLERSPLEHSWRRLNRRLLHAGLFAGIDGEECPPLVIAIDTSGSINDEILAAFNAKIRAAVADFRPRAVTIIYCDDEINGEPQTYAPDDLPTLTPHGGGGTDFRPPFKWVAENMPHEAPAALVYLTDLDGPAPTEPTEYPTIWAAIPNRYQTQPAFGQVVPLVLA